MAMELRHLRYFAVTAEEGHITRAAECLDMQQPPLSRQIKALERELGVQLFRRKARGVELTDAGGTLLQAARDILPRVQRAIEATQRTAKGEQGQVRIGAAPTAPFHAFVPRVVRSFRDAFPRVTLTLEESLSHDLFQRLRDEQIDVAFYRSPPSDRAGLRIEPLLQERMIMAVPKGLRQAAQIIQRVFEVVCERYVHCLWPPPWAGSLRCNDRGVSGGGFQSAAWAGGTS